ncbi:PRC-barrel domain-containing protein [Salinarimonas sp.]|uniref:PRC-barrel domain-containing protein n=1 Tax=Salinarimonas sp. TaxID=2766526 RepID=UPI0032D8BE5A
MPPAPTARFAVAACLALAAPLCAGPAVAQTDEAVTAPITPLAPGEAADAVATGAGPLAVTGDAPLYRLEEITDVSVVNALGEEIGEVDGYVVQGDRVVYARISIGGILGLGDTEITVPFGALAFRQAQTGREATLEAVIETVRTQDQLDALVRAAPAR